MGCDWYYVNVFGGVGVRLTFEQVQQMQQLAMKKRRLAGLKSKLVPDILAVVAKYDSSSQTSGDAAADLRVPPLIRS